MLLGLNFTKERQQETAVLSTGQDQGCTLLCHSDLELQLHDGIGLVTRDIWSCAFQHTFSKSYFIHSIVPSNALEMIQAWGCFCKHIISALPLLLL